MPRQKVAWLFTGPRDWEFKYQARLEKALDSLNIMPGPGGDVIIHGKAAGFDSAVHRWGRRQGVMIIEVEYPNWRGNNRRKGGPLRNEQMINILQGLTSLGYAARCIVGQCDPNWTMKTPGSGTADCARRMKAKGFRTQVVKVFGPNS